MNRIFGFSPRLGRALIGHFGSAENVFSEGGKRIKEALPYTEGVDRITDKEYEISEKELQGGLPPDCCFIGIGEKGYPEMLKECGDAPIGLYVKGCSPPELVFGTRKSIAVIGTRDLSPYGMDWCGRIVSAIASTAEPPAIVSGLAIGVDITAQRKALDCGIPTIGVMATGIDGMYPARHIHDAKRICRTPGCALITDYPPGTQPLKVNFLRRNRIIAGICRTTILIESKAKGGGMMTARLAFGYDRDVFALPGRADDLRSQGCNMLIKEGIAEAIVDTEHLIRSMGLETGAKRIEEKPYTSHISQLPDDRTGALSRILLAVKNNRGADIEAIAEITGLDYQTVSSCICILETDGIVTVDLMQRCSIRT